MLHGVCRHCAEYYRGHVVGIAPLYGGQGSGKHHQKRRRTVQRVIGKHGQRKGKAYAQHAAQRKAQREQRAALHSDAHQKFGDEQLRHEYGLIQVQRRKLIHIR